MSNIETFKEEFPTLESYWRSIILFGRNVSSYKFALAKSLLEYAPTGKTEITIEELAAPFSKNLCEHLLMSPKQTTSKSGQVLDACTGYNQGLINKEQLIDITTKKGFDYVLDSFHIINTEPLPVEFYKKEYSRTSKKIILTDEIFKLEESEFFGNLEHEVESRWNLVETAWEMGVSHNILNVEYDNAKQILFIDDKLRRKDVTSARSALNGYQKGKCFYCFCDISVESDDVCDIDHFYPYTLQKHYPQVNFNGVWNLVLSCPNCNRGESGKFAKAPAIKYLERLSKRNEFLISSHHPLRETLIQQTGNTVTDRRLFLKAMDKNAINILIQRWTTEQVGEEVF